MLKEPPVANDSQAGVKSQEGMIFESQEEAKEWSSAMIQ